MSSLFFFVLPFLNFQLNYKENIWDWLLFFSVGTKDNQDRDGAILSAHQTVLVLESNFPSPPPYPFRRMRKWYINCYFETQLIPGCCLSRCSYVCCSFRTEWEIWDKLAHQTHVPPICKMAQHAEDIRCIWRWCLVEYMYMTTEN